MTDKKIDNLLKGSAGTASNGNNCITYGRRKINGICKSLSVDTKNYRPAKTIDSICDYLSKKNNIDRLLYSEMSNYIFSLNLERRGVFATNVDNLLQYTLSIEFKCDNEKETDDCRKIVIKIYDHFQLALNQIENVKNILSDGIEGVKESIRKDKYITILAIFSSIVVAFVGGVSFSKEVLQSMSNVSIYRLLLIVDGLGFILLNVVYMMISLIFKINDKEDMKFSIFGLNLALMVIAVVIVAGWVFNVHMYPSYLSKYQYWCK